MLKELKVKKKKALLITTPQTLDVSINLFLKNSISSANFFFENGLLSRGCEGVVVKAAAKKDEEAEKNFRKKQWMGPLCPGKATNQRT